MHMKITCNSITCTWLIYCARQRVDVVFLDGQFAISKNRICSIMRISSWRSSLMPISTRGRKGTVSRQGVQLCPVDLKSYY